MNYQKRVARKLYMQRHTKGFAYPSPRQGLGNGLQSPIDIPTNSESFQAVSITLPHEGLATRRPALKQAKTSRGHSVHRGIILWHESLLELRVSYKLQTWHNVAEIHSQYPKVTFVDHEGKTRTHTFDYYVVFEDGRRLAIAVKMYRKRKAMIDLLDRIKAEGISFKGGPRLADSALLMTEKDGNVNSFHNCSQIILARKECPPEAVTELRKTLCRMTGRFQFANLLFGASRMDTRRAAIWRLIDLGELVAETTDRIDELTYLRRFESTEL